MEAYGKRRSLLSRTLALIRPVDVSALPGTGVGCVAH